MKNIFKILEIVLRVIAGLFLLIVFIALVYGLIFIFFQDRLFFFLIVGVYGLCLAALIHDKFKIILRLKRGERI